jgi:hypothetical protein
MLTKEQTEKLLKIVAYNEELMDLADGDQSSAKGLITFLDESEGVDIWHPFYDTTLRCEVDPIKEYGMEGIQQMLNEYDKLGVSK